MKANSYISKKEYKFLIILFIVVLFLTVANISSKFIGSYNFAVQEAQISLERMANQEQNFYISDCYSGYNHPAFFAIFSAFILLTSLSFKKLLNTSYFSILSFCFLSVWFVRTTYLLDYWFISITNAKWNSILVNFDIFDLLLWIGFLIISFFQAKIIYRFVTEKFQAKLSLK